MSSEIPWPFNEVAGIAAEPIQVLLEPGAIGLTKAYPGDAGYDLHVFQDTIVEPGGWADVRSGVRVALPVRTYARIVARSSAFRKRGLLVLEGIIDEGFRGELFSTAYNPRPFPVYLQRGMSIAQLIVQPVPQYDVAVVKTLPTSERGESGFGSSGR